VPSRTHDFSRPRVVPASKRCGEDAEDQERLRLRLVRNVVLDRVLQKRGELQVNLPGQAGQATAGTEAGSPGSYWHRGGPVIWPRRGADLGDDEAKEREGVVGLADRGQVPSEEAWGGGLVTAAAAGRCTSRR
jgi:hypothetical protein